MDTYYIHYTYINMGICLDRAGVHVVALFHILLVNKRSIYIHELNALFCINHLTV